MQFFPYTEFGFYFFTLMVKFVMYQDLVIFVVREKLTESYTLFFEQSSATNSSNWIKGNPCNAQFASSIN